MLKEENPRKNQRPWKKSKKRRDKTWSGQNGRHRQVDQEEGNLRQIKKDKRGGRIDWRELLMEEEYELDDG